MVASSAPSSGDRPLDERLDDETDRGIITRCVAENFNS